MYVCNDCSPNPTYHNGGNWYQFAREGNVVRLHDSLIHTLQNHPDKVSRDILEKINPVFG